jgi:hypothetical protein
MSMDDSQQGFIKCPDCDFISLSQGGLGVHRSKRHKITIPDEVKSLFVERIFQRGNLSIAVYVMSLLDQSQILEDI